MASVDEPGQEFVILSQEQYLDLFRVVDKIRRQGVERQEKEHPPRKDMNRDEFARWIARQHFAIDKGIVRIFYLPADAPPKEVRLLEVNDLLSIPEQAAIEAVDFMPEIDGLDFSLIVADVTPRQFEEIREGKIGLPKGWKLKDAVEIRKCVE